MNRRRGGNSGRRHAMSESDRIRAAPPGRRPREPAFVGRPRCAPSPRASAPTVASRSARGRASRAARRRRGRCARGSTAGARSATCAARSRSGSPASRRRRRRRPRRRPTSRRSCATRRRGSTLLEARIAESQSQQAALEALYRDLAPSRDEIALSEIEQVLLVASQQLQLAGNVPSALTALQLADAKLQRLDRPQFLPLRRALASDMDQLKAMPFVDVTGLEPQARPGDGAVAPTLPLAMDERLPPPAAAGACRAADVPAWQRSSPTLWARHAAARAHRDRPTGRRRRCSRRRSSTSCARTCGCGCCPRASRCSTATTRASRPTSRPRRACWIGQYFDTRTKSVQTVQATLKQLAATPLRRRDAGPRAQPRSAARAARSRRSARRGPTGRAAPGPPADGARPPCASCSGSCCSPPRQSPSRSRDPKLVGGYALFVAPPYRIELSLNLFLLLVDRAVYALGYALVRLAPGVDAPAGRSAGVSPPAAAGDAGAREARCRGRRAARRPLRQGATVRRGSARDPAVVGTVGAGRRARGDRDARLRRRGEARSTGQTAQTRASPCRGSCSKRR